MFTTRWAKKYKSRIFRYLNPIFKLRLTRKRILFAILCLLTMAIVGWYNRLIFRLFTGPRLYRVYRTSGMVYSPNHLESCGDNIIRIISVAWSVTVYTSPILVLYLSRSGYCSLDGILSLLKLASWVGIIFLSAIFVRGVGRFASPQYKTFLNTLETAHDNFNKHNKASLAAFDFDFSAWPIEYNVSDSVTSKRGEALKVKSTSRGSLVSTVTALPCRLLSYVAVHTIGKRMVYPGSVGLLQTLTGAMMLEGRAKLVEKFKGERFKLNTSEGNFIDSMFVDRRKSVRQNNDYLVVCCEGNAGFYEFGLMFTALDLKMYSVLGWNHPGFGGSTGTPFPKEEQSAIDTVMQFAITKLGFPVENIIIFAWSIGGYTASWAAMMYPDVKGLVLDATFDDILPLALARMPPSWNSLIIRTIRDYLNLVIVDHVLNYQGPVIMYRRTQDEVISTNESDPLQSNRGNELLIKVLQHRFPKLFGGESVHLVREWLHSNGDQKQLLWDSRNIEERSCELLLHTYINEHSSAYPMMIGEDMLTSLKEELGLYLISKHLEDFDATHCMPLPSGRFKIPWNPNEIHNKHKE